MKYRCPYCKNLFSEATRPACPVCGRTLLLPGFFRKTPPRPDGDGGPPETASARTAWSPSNRRLARPGKPLPFLGVSGLKMTAILLIMLGIGGALVSRSKAPPPPDQDARKIDRARLSLANLRVALELYRQDCGAYPSTDAGLASLIHPPSPDLRWQGPYITELKNDLWGTPFQYRRTETNLFLFGCGPDRRPETADDLVVKKASITLRLEEGYVHAIVIFLDGSLKIIRHQFPTDRAIRADMLPDRSR